MGRALRREVERIDRATPGEIGVYVKRLDSGDVLSYGAEQRWYLGSTTKLRWRSRCCRKSKPAGCRWARC